MPFDSARTRHLCSQACVVDKHSKSRDFSPRQADALSPARACTRRWCTWHTTHPSRMPRSTPFTPWLCWTAALAPAAAMAASLAPCRAARWLWRCTQGPGCATCMWRQAAGGRSRCQQAPLRGSRAQRMMSPTAAPAAFCHQSRLQRRQVQACLRHRLQGSARQYSHQRSAWTARSNSSSSSVGVASHPFLHPSSEARRRSSSSAAIGRSHTQLRRGAY